MRLSRSSRNSDDVDNWANGEDARCVRSGSIVATAEHEVSKKPTARLCLSYEPQIASASESVAELLHVIFGAVMHRYEHLHEHGLLGDSSFFMLKEAVGEAVDCANDEQFSARVEDFNRDGMRVSLRSLRVRSGNRPRSLGVFEPVIVEFLSLEAQTGKGSLFDRLPTTWLRTRALGYSQTLAKVESLWAFVHVHEAVLEETPSLDRFQDLKFSLEMCVKEAKENLEETAHLQTRRYYYAQHSLLLRHIFHKRHDRLKRFVEEGWVDRSDGIPLCENILERIVHVDMFLQPLLLTSIL
jgi:hypothetical protein